jgi:protein involved in polysaccharide export with SLBB domain
MVRLATTALVLTLFGLPHLPAIAQSGAPVVQAERGSVFITGAVNKPGKYPLVEKMNVLHLVTLAGGFRPSANRERLIIVSGTLKDADGKPLTRFVNYSDIMKGKYLKENLVELGPLDQVIVG